MNKCYSTDGEYFDEYFPCDLEEVGQVYYERKMHAGEDMFHKIMNTAIKYEQWNGVKPNVLELTQKEYDDLKDYLGVVFISRCPTESTQDSFGDMKIVIKG